MIKILLLTKTPNKKPIMSMNNVKKKVKKQYNNLLL